MGKSKYNINYIQKSLLLGFEILLSRRTECIRISELLDFGETCWNASLELFVYSPLVKGTSYRNRKVNILQRVMDFTTLSDLCPIIIEDN